MVTSSGSEMFIGCACDRKFAEHTAVMLTSIDINGGVPDAVVLVAAYDLTSEHRELLRAGAGALGARMRFVDITQTLLPHAESGRYSIEYPPTVLGRLFLPDAIDVQNARLITVDSDMIVNASLRPLFELDLRRHYLAAVHDFPRHHDQTYFNSGLMRIDVDTYKHYDVSNRALRWIEDRADPAHFPDQDALNWVVGKEWHRLDRSWNYFYSAGEPEISEEHYGQVHVAHFAGPKPWDYEHHRGRQLYMHYRDILRARVRNGNA